MSALSRFKDQLDQQYRRGVEDGKVARHRSYLAAFHIDAEYERWAYNAGHEEGLRQLDVLRKAILRPEGEAS